MDKFTLVTGSDYMETIYRNAVDEGFRYLKNNPNVKTLVVGVSGGIDSAMTIALARAVVDKVNSEFEDGHKLVGYSIPILSNKEDEVERAYYLGRKLCDEFEEIVMNTTFMRLATGIEKGLELPQSTEEGKIRRGNIKARLRMIYLYNQANLRKGIVLSTDNYTEFLLGFWTLHGDVGDFGFIQELWKTEVYELADWMVAKGLGGKELQACIDAKPTDGLGVTNSDLDQLLPGWTGSYREGYRHVDEMLLNWINSIDVDTWEAAEFQKLNSDHPVIKRHLRTRFKRLNPYNLKKSWLLNL